MGHSFVLFLLIVSHRLLSQCNGSNIFLPYLRKRPYVDIGIDIDVFIMKGQEFFSTILLTFFSSNKTKSFNTMIVSIKNVRVVVLLKNWELL